jgi:hypothetical protein
VDVEVQRKGRRRVSELDGEVQRCQESRQSGARERNRTLNLAINIFEVSMSLNIASSFPVNWLPHSEGGERQDQWTMQQSGTM